MLTKQMKLDRASEKLAEMADLIRGLSEAADEVATLVPDVWNGIEAKNLWLQDVDEKTAQFFGRAAFNLQPPERED